MKYVLLVDKNQDILNIQSLALSSFYTGEVVLVTNSKEAVVKIKTFGNPELIVADQLILVDASEQSLYKYLVKLDQIIPLIICSDGIEHKLKENDYPLVSSFIQKPFSIEALSYLVKSITTAPLAQPKFIAVKFPVLLNLISQSFDLYLKLSDVNHVKLIKSGEPFTKEDADKLLGKGVDQLYVSAENSFEFLKSYEENLNLLLASKNGDFTQENMVDTIDAMASIEHVSKRLGWSPEAVESAKKSVEAALRILSKDTHIKSILKAKLANPSSNYARHVSLLAYMSCVFGKDIGWGGEVVQTKLAMAALLHDIAVDESYYDDIKGWNAKAADQRDRTPETIKYRLHPLEASKMIQKIPNIPPDIDQILLQHHEKKDGSGFPRSLTSTRIGQLSCFFNIMEELVEFIGDGEEMEARIFAFRLWGEAQYESGNYKKIFQFIMTKLDKSL